jgi:hypothetical protein
VDSWKEHLVVSSADVTFLDFAADSQEAAELIIAKAKGVVV